MKIIFYSLLSIISFFLVKEPDNNNNCLDYPQKIIDLKATDIYDSARWVIYNWLGSKKLDDIYYGQMELKYKNVQISNDTIVIHFNFYSIDNSSTNKNELLEVTKTSVTINRSTKKCIWAFNYPFEDFSSNLSTGDKLLESAASINTINFLKTKSKINSCFLELARLRKLLE